MLAELPEGSSLKSKQLSQRMNVSHSYLIKVAKKLKEAGIINATASKTGGYTLKKEIEEITFLDVFNATEGEESFSEGVDNKPIDDMFLSKEIINEKRKQTHDILLSAEQEYRKRLNEHKLIEIVPRDKNGEILKIEWDKMIENI